jgi:hypothetical protein
VQCGQKNLEFFYRRKRNSDKEKSGRGIGKEFESLRPRRKKVKPGEEVGGGVKS